MIKIIHPNLEEIAEKYFDDIKNKCIERATYLGKNINVIFNGLPHINLTNDPLNGNSKKSLSNIFLVPARKLQDQHNYHQLVLTNCHPWVGTYQNAVRLITDYLIIEDNLKKLILCSPENSIQIETDIKNHIGVNNISYKAISSVINKIIDYSLFDDLAYGISNKLGHNTCPYCNRSYIHTIIDKRKKGLIRPTFDHFFSQTDHPLLALSFYNLIPSCYYCNSSLKGDKVMELATHLHPYLEGFGNDIKFHILIKDNKPDKSHPENYHLFLQTELQDFQPKYQKTFFSKTSGHDEHRGNINLFKLNEIYNAHKDVVGELIVKCDSLSMSYADSLIGFFPLLKTNKSEFYRFYFSNYFYESDFHKRPLAKMSKDIVSKTLPYFLE
jgi:hypothetical protein